MTPQAVFIETTVQIQRAFTGPEAIPSVSDAALYTSDYVWMEYQRTIVADYAHVHRVARRSKHWGDLLHNLLTGQRAFRPRSAVRCTQIVARIYIESKSDWERALALLDNTLRFDLYHRFWTHVSPLPDAIHCDLAAHTVTRQADGTYAVPETCRKDTASCRLPDFLAAHRVELRAIEDYLAVHPNVIKDQPRVERLLTAVLADHRAALGQAACWPLGDIIITLQVPSDALLWTLDPDFAPLTAALGKRLFPSGR